MIGSSRDFAYVARDNLTQVLKCHVFRCDSPAKNIATSLHDMCSKVRLSSTFTIQSVANSADDFTIRSPEVCSSRLQS